MDGELCYPVLAAAAPVAPGGTALRVRLPGASGSSTTSFAAGGGRPCPRYGDVVVPMLARSGAISSAWWSTTCVRLQPYRAGDDLPPDHPQSALAALLAAVIAATVHHPLRRNTRQGQLSKRREWTGPRCARGMTADYVIERVGGVESCG